MTQRERSSLPIVLLAGPFSVLFMIVFSPVGFTPFESGDALALSPYAQTLATVAWMAVVGVPLATVLPVDESRAARATAAVAGVLCPLAALCLALLVHAPATPVLVSVLLGTGCMAQLAQGAAFQAGTDLPDLPGAVALALLVAAGVCVVAGMLPAALYGTAFVAGVAALCGAAWALLARRGVVCAGDASPAAPDALGCVPCAVTDARADADRPLLRLMQFDGAPLIGGVICALSFGLGWSEPVLGAMVRQPLVAFLGKVAGSFALVLAFRTTRRTSKASPLECCVAVAAGIGASIGLLPDAQPADPFLMALSSVSQVLFIGILWVEASFTSRELRHPSVLPLMGVVLFLGAYAAGALASPLVSWDAVSTLVALGFVWLLVFLAFRTARQTQPEDTTAAPGQYGEAFGRALARLVEDYALTRRESEVLPYLVFGLSSTMVAQRLYCSPQTVKSHAHRIYAKMGIHSHEELVGQFEARTREEPGSVGPRA